MPDTHNNHQDTENTTNTSQESPSLPPAGGRSARERAMLSDHDAKVWGEVQEVDGGYNVSNPVAVKRKMGVGEKTRRACALKLAGASYASIAETLGYSDASGARKAVMRGMESTLQESAGELRKLHYGRLEHLLGLLWPDVNALDLPSMKLALDVMDRMDRLFGLSAPDRLDVGVGGRETVIVADGDKEAYLKALADAGHEVQGATLDTTANEVESH